MIHPPLSISLRLAPCLCQNDSQVGERAFALLSTQGSAQTQGSMQKGVCGAFLDAEVAFVVILALHPLFLFSPQ